MNTHWLLAAGGAAAIGSSVLIACDASDEPAGVRHPRDEFIVDAAAPLRVLSLGDVPSISATNVEIVAQLLTLEKGDSLAKWRPVEPTFGAVVSTAMDSAGNTFILDNRLNQLVMVGPLGNQQQVLGRPGNGGGEFTEPRVVAVSNDGEITVADFGRRLHFFRPTERGYQHGETVRLDVPIEDVCRMESNVVVHARSATRPELLHIIDKRGHLQRSFGELYRTANEHINRELVRGQIDCAPSEGVILYAPNAGIAQLRAYDLAGNIRWRTRIDGYIPIDVFQPADRPGSMRISVPPGGYHTVRTLIYDGRGQFVVQVAFVSRTGAQTQTDEKLFTFVLSAKDGNGSLVSTNIAQIGALNKARVALIARGVKATVLLSEFAAVRRSETAEK